MTPTIEEFKRGIDHAISRKRHKEGIFGLAFSSAWKGKRAKASLERLRKALEK